MINFISSERDGRIFLKSDQTKAHFIIFDCIDKGAIKGSERNVQIFAAAKTWAAGCEALQGFHFNQK